MEILMKTTTLRPLILALLTAAPCMRAMESNNNNNVPQNNIATALLSDSCTPSEKKLQYLKKIKADLAE